MPHEFRDPDFDRGQLELRFENDIVCIYGTKEGLKRLVTIIQGLIDRPAQGHIHLEKEIYDFLTSESEKGAIAIFPKG